MNDDQTPVTPEPQDQQQPAVPPAAPQMPPRPQPITPSINDITRVESRPVGPQAINPLQSSAPQQVQAPSQPRPLDASTSAQPTVQQSPVAPDSAQAPDPAAQYQEEADQNASIADTIKTIFWGFINWVAAPLLIVFILHNFVFQAYHVDGSSMAPTLATSDYMIISKVENTIAKLTGKKYIPRRHQVVVFSYPQDPSLIFIKRVIALPGERVVVKDGKITVYNSENPDGFSPDDDSFERSATYTEGDVDEVVPEGSVVVVGDNRLPSGSFDSREWGMLPSQDIIGNSIIRLLPLDGLRFFSKLAEGQN